MTGLLNNIRLSAKIVSLISFCLIILLFVLFIVYNSMFQKTLIQQESIKGQEITKMFARISESPMMRQDYFSLEYNVKELQKNEDINYALVCDKNGIPLTPSTNPIKTGQIYTAVFRENIIGPDSESIGYVEVSFNLQKTHALIFKSKAWFLAISTLIVITILLVLYFLIMKVIVKPINKLLNTVSLITNGDLNQRVEIDTADEIGTLSKDFNQMTEKLRSSIEMIENILESMPSLLISITKDGTILEWNTVAGKITGIPSEEAFNKNLWEITSIFSKYKGLCQDVIRTGNPKKLKHETLIENEEKIYEVFLYPLKSENIEGVVLRIDDITDIEKIESQLRQAQKMETVGTLAGGLAHDFNNVLCGIVGTLSLVRYKITNKDNIPIDTIEKYIDTIEESSNRASDMVQQFLALSRKQELSLNKVDLNMAMKHIMKICKNTFDKCVNIDFSYYPEEALVYADLTQLEQVILNLTINAYHSMTIMRKENELQGGTLKLWIEQIKADKYFVKGHPEAGFIPYWKFTINDTGIGIEQKNLAKIFDPFFTTKDKGQGTGLGLTMVYNIIKQHNGFIDVYSEPGIGSNFILYLPTYNSEENAEDLYQNQQQILFGKGETILIVDDEQLIQQIAQDILIECGYKVLIASNGEEGVEIYQKHKHRIDLVLLDMVMPKMSGKEAFIQMKKINPNIKVLLSSGFKMDDRVEKVMDLGVCGFIQKPYTLEKLSKMIWDIFYKN